MKENLLSDEFIKTLIDNRMVGFRQRVAGWFAAIILYQNRYEVSHECDPPWDSSGSVYTCGGFDLKDYCKLIDFLQEPNGNSSATYVSGCGLWYDTYEKTLQEIAEEYVHSILCQLEEVESAGDLDDDILEKADIAIMALIERSTDWLCTELFAEGTAAAMLEHAELQAKSLEREAQLYAGLLLAKQYNIDLETQANKGTPEWKQIRSLLIQLSEKDIKLLAPVLRVSNSIRLALIQGQVPK